MNRPIPQVSERLFSEVTALGDGEGGRYTGGVDRAWTIGGKPHGGYLLAMLARAAASLTPHDHVIAASSHYLRAPKPGPVGVEAEVLRAGRSTSQVRARMTQDGQGCVEALLTVSQFGTGVAPRWEAGLPEVGTERYEECVRLVSQTPDRGTVALMDQVEVRLEPESTGFMSGRPTGRGELRGWLALPGREDFDPNSLLFAVDAFPPATFDIEFSGWVPTLELTAYVRALPASGPVRVLQRAQLIDAQRVDEACFVWDRNGRLVAQATQLAGVRLG